MYDILTDLKIVLTSYKALTLMAMIVKATFCEMIKRILVYST